MSSAPRFPWTHILGILPLVDAGVHGEIEGRARRFSSRKKVEVVLGVLRGEALDLVSREAGITAATLLEWRDHFVTSGQAAPRLWLTAREDAERLNHVAE